MAHMCPCYCSRTTFQRSFFCWDVTLALSKSRCYFSIFSVGALITSAQWLCFLFVAIFVVCLHLDHKKWNLTFFCPPSYEKKNYLVYCSSLNNSILHRFLIRHLLDLKTVNFGSTPFGFSKKKVQSCAQTGSYMDVLKVTVITGTKVLQIKNWTGLMADIKAVHYISLIWKPASSAFFFFTSFHLFQRKTKLVTCCFLGIWHL